MEEEIDVYGDLPEYDLGKEIANHQEKIKELDGVILKLSNQITEQQGTIEELKKTRDIIEKNVSELYKTAKREIDRKNTQIAELREKLENLEKNVHQNNYKKRIRDSVDDSNQQKKQKFSDNDKLQGDNSHIKKHSSFNRDSQRSEKSNACSNNDKKNDTDMFQSKNRTHSKDKDPRNERHRDSRDNQRSRHSHDDHSKSNKKHDHPHNKKKHDDDDKAKCEAPKDKSKVPSDKSKLSSDKSKLPSDKSKLPSDKSKLPSDKNKLSSDKTRAEDNSKRDPKSKTKPEKESLKKKDDHRNCGSKVNKKVKQNEVPSKQEGAGNITAAVDRTDVTKQESLDPLNSKSAAKNKDIPVAILNSLSQKEIDVFKESLDIVSENNSKSMKTVEKIIQTTEKIAIKNKNIEENLGKLEKNTSSIDRINRKIEMLFDSPDKRDSINTGKSKDLLDNQRNTESDEREVEKNINESNALPIRPMDGSSINNERNDSKDNQKEELETSQKIITESEKVQETLISECHDESKIKSYSLHIQNILKDLNQDTDAVKTNAESEHPIHKNTDNKLESISSTSNIVDNSDATVNKVDEKQVKDNNKENSESSKIIKTLVSEKIIDILHTDADSIVHSESKDIKTSPPHTTLKLDPVTKTKPPRRSSKRILNIEKIITERNKSQASKKKDLAEKSVDALKIDQVGKTKNPIEILSTDVAVDLCEKVKEVVNQQSENDTIQKQESKPVTVTVNKSKITSPKETLKSFKNVLSKNLDEDFPELHLTHNGEIPVLHLEEDHFKNVPPDAHMPDSNIINLMDAMNVTASALECDMPKFKNSSNENVAPKSPLNLTKEGSNESENFVNSLNKVTSTPNQSLNLSKDTPIQDRSNQIVNLANGDSINKSNNFTINSGNLTTNTSVIPQKRRRRVVMSFADD